MTLRLAFFGTSEFAVPVLTALVKEGYAVVVITAPDAPAGRDKVLTPSPIKLAAQKLGLNILQPTNLKEDLKTISFKLKLEIGIVVAYGKIIPAEIINLFPRGILNIHPSLLPKYRGPSPIQHALLNGDTETGVTIIKIDDQVDHGGIVNSEKWVVDSSVKYEELEKELAKLGAELLIKTLPEYLAGKIKPRPQDDSQATFTKMINKTDGKVDWHRDARAIYNQFRAFHHWPGIWTRWHDKILKILDCTTCDVVRSGVVQLNGMIGELYQKDNHLFIPCQPGYLEILSLQLPGGKPLSAQEFINGYGKFLSRV